MVKSTSSKRSRAVQEAKTPQKKPKVTLEAYPQLLKEWHPTKNGDLDPCLVAAGSSKKVWWKCQVTNCAYEWETYIKNRKAGRGCPICARISDKTRFSLVANPKVLAEWNHEKNGTLLPRHVAKFTNKYVWWICQICKNEWKVSVAQRTRGSRCPKCVKAEKRYTSKLCDSNRFSIHGDERVKAEWNIERNGTLKPSEVTLKSRKKVWWKCKDCLYEWKSSLGSRANSKGCPSCNRKVLSDLNRFSLHASPKLIREWHPAKNLPLKPDQISIGSSKKIWWKCSVATCDYEWIASLNNRRFSSGCPACCGKVVTRKNALSSVSHGQLLIKEWHPHKNGKLESKDVSRGSQKKVWWKCSNKTCEYEWNASVYSRTYGTGCPICCFVSDEIRFSLNVEGSVLLEWNYEKNGSLRPNHIAKTSEKKVWWKCHRECCQHIWKMEIYKRARGGYYGSCPACRKPHNNRKLSDSNRFSIHGDPKLQKEWHPTKNGTLKKSDVTINYSIKKIWWMCSKCSFEWESPMYTRRKNSECPACRRLVLSDINRFSLKASKELIDEWYWDKNLPLRPLDVTLVSHHKVWWKCSKIRCGFVWKSRIGGRTNHGRGCPRCKASKMEKKVSSVLSTVDNMEIKTQQRILYRDNSFTWVDFTVILPDEKQLIIETDGEQHFDPENYFVKKSGPGAYAKLLQRDRKQDKFCLKRGDHVLRIPYTTKFEDIPKILQEAIDLRGSSEKPTITYIDHKLYERHFLSKDDIDFIENKL